MSFSFAAADILYRNLGGHGPDTPAGASAGSQGIRYVNVGRFYDLNARLWYFDLLLTNRSQYIPYNASLNTLQGPFAQVNLACNQAVDLRVTTILSCATAPSCAICDASPSIGQRDSCYADGCSCLGSTVNTASACEGASK